MDEKISNYFFSDTAKPMWSPSLEVAPVDSIYRHCIENFQNLRISNLLGH